MLKQPMAGIIATVIVLTFALGFISLFSFELFTGWISYSLMCIIPALIVIGVVWGGNPPRFLANLGQFLKGLTLLSVASFVGIIVGSIMFYTIGGSMFPLAPMLVHFTIIAIGTAFLLVIIMGGWPILPRVKNPVLAGFAILLAVYAVSFILFRVLYSYEFLIGTPLYAASLDPQGLFNGWNVTVFYVTFIGVMFAILHLDLWPLTKFPALMKQPVLGIVFTILCLGLTSLTYYLGISVVKINVVSFMVLVPIPFVFGSVIVLNMLQDTLFSKVKQPVKGVLKIGLALMIGLVLAKTFLMFARGQPGPANV